MDDISPQKSSKVVKTTDGDKEMSKADKEASKADKEALKADEKWRKQLEKDKAKVSLFPQVMEHS